MKPLLFTVLAAYVVAAIHSTLAFINKRRSAERIAFASLSIGLAMHTTLLLLDWAQEGHYPLFGIRETLSFLAWTLVTTYLVALYYYRAPSLGAFILPLVAMLTGVSVITQVSVRQNSVTADNTAWIFPVHTTLWIFAYACLFLVFVASIMYLLLERELKLKTFSAVFHRLPSLTTVNDIAATTAGIGFTLVTLGIITGMTWSASRDGRIWRNDPKEIFAAMTWLLYLGLIIYRSTARWRGSRAAWIGVVGFAFVICTFIGARLFGSYHVFG
jgi:ABC-type uncharacterized transport system permease subunit